jgi:hypothetical protein
MAHVRPILPHPRAVPIRPGLPNHQAVPMRQLGIRQQAAPIRPLVIHHQRNPRIPTLRRLPVAVKRTLPQYLPVLQPPIFPGLSNFDDEEEEYYEEEVLNYPTVGLIDQHKITTQQLPHRVPTSMSLQNHHRQLTRRVKPNHPPSFNRLINLV